ncbi:MAG: deoxyribonuclease [Thermoplasmata archaeon]|jgi:deoxyribonuclease-4|nr:deoxyribonuclease [Thermoplasmata archaeon]
MMKLGAHNSIAGGLHNAVAECVAIGGDALQMFCKNQRQWKAKPIAPEDAKAFRDAVAAAKVGPLMVHDSYLINMGHPDDGKREQARLAFLDEYQRSELLGVHYLNFHPGSHCEEDKKLRDDRRVRDACLDRIAACMNQVLDETKGSGCKLVIENAAGQGTNVGNSWEEVGRLVDAVSDKARVGVTIDTQHSWACGYDWRDHYDECWDGFEAAVGRKHLVAFHLNDSKQPCGARVDRHDTIGEGLLGLEFFRTLVNDRRLDGVAGYLETPEGPESWKKEIALLRSLRTDEPLVRAKKAAKPKQAVL